MLIKKKTAEGPTTTKYRYSKDLNGKCMVVKFDDGAYPNINITCSRAKFETEGKLCKHIFKIMHFLWLETFPECCMLKCWSIHARLQVSSVGCQGSKNDDIANGSEATHLMNRCS